MGREGRFEIHFTDLHLVPIEHRVCDLMSAPELSISEQFAEDLMKCIYAVKQFPSLSLKASLGSFVHEDMSASLFATLTAKLET
jgi:hypothetical protein